jgi:DMSO/TMAO reductase YedYZ molybdopterin-dependent catalytic subunit
VRISLLPPGQHAVSALHRFGLTRFAARFPRETSTCTLEIAGHVAQPLKLFDPLQGLQRTEQTCDFHCVTTWSVRALRWEGVRFTDFYHQVILPRAGPRKEATLLWLRAQDGARTAMLLEDLLASDVLLADRLNGAALTTDHGAPLRLIAPAHYGYKSAKHLSRIEFRDLSEDYPVSGFRFMDHLRARVAYEERGRWFPGWLLRYMYRPLIATTVKRFAAASKSRLKSE